ncbi:MAG: matrixin family metalloprotease [Methylococcaceae bacterium]|nr:matrixin family metalloprotease [Methylococcaceae bacterium]MDP3903431.1 matrixin family metalloprotease [Methylococcaceae bacterium]
MPQAISSTDIQQLTDSIKYADDASKQSKIVEAYTYLYDHGYDYAGWARGVAAQDTVAGISAMNFLADSAMMGVGSWMCQTLPDSTVLDIKTGMALDYLNVLAVQAEKTGGINTADINGLDVWKIHQDVFRDNGLGIENWTLNSFFEIVQKGWGDQGVEKAWQVIRDTGGDWLDGTAANLGVLDFMWGASYSSDAGVRALADNWLNTVVPLFIPGGDRSKLGSLLGSLVTNNILNFANILGSVLPSQNPQPTGEWIQYDGGYGAVSWVYEVSVTPDPWWWSSPTTSTPTVTVEPIGPTTFDDTPVYADVSTSEASNSNYYDPGITIDYSFTYYDDYYSDGYSCYPYYYDNYDYYGYYGFAGTQSTVTKAIGADIGYIAQQAINDSDFAAAAAAAVGRQQAEDAALLSTLPSNTGSAVLEGAHWDHQVITWSLANSNSSSSDAFSHFLDASYEGDVQKAFATWAAASGLSFREVADSEQSNIRIGFGAFDTANSGVAGYTSFRGINGAIQSNAIIRLEDPDQLALVAESDGQKIYAGTEAEFSQLLLHEIGHALGLGSNADPYSVMYYQLNANNRTLDSTDITGIKSLYCPGQSERAITNTGADQLIQALSSFAPASSSQTSLLASNDPIINQPLLAVAS